VINYPYIDTPPQPTIDLLAQHFPQLSSLTLGLHLVSVIELNLDFESLTRLTQLELLEVRETVSFSDAALQTLWNSCPYLRVLRLFHADLKGDALTYDPSRSYPSLQELKLSGCGSLTYQGLTDILRSSSALSTFSLGGCIDNPLTGAEIGQLLMNYTTLKTIKITGYREVPLISIWHSHLESLDLSEPLLSSQDALHPLHQLTSLSLFEASLEVVQKVLIQSPQLERLDILGISGGERYIKMLALRMFAHTLLKENFLRTLYIGISDTDWSFNAEDLEAIFNYTPHLTDLTIFNDAQPGTMRESQENHFSQRSLALQSLKLVKLECSSQSITNILCSSSNLTSLHLDRVPIEGDQLLKAVELLSLKKLRLWRCPNVLLLESLAIVKELRSRGAKVKIFYTANRWG
jgi:hypothetical protein